MATLLSNINNDDLINSLSRFCALNDIYWPTGQVGGLNIETEFVKQLKRDYPQRTDSDMRTIFSEYNKGELEVSKPRKMSLRFIGDLLKASRELKRTIHTPGQQYHTPQKEVVNIDDAKKAWQYQFDDWVKMVEHGHGCPIGKMMEIHDENALNAGIYEAGDFTKAELTAAKESFIASQKREDVNFLGNRIKKSLRQNVPQVSYDIEAVARLGAHYNRMRSLGYDSYELPDEVLTEILR